MRPFSGRARSRAGWAPRHQTRVKILFTLLAWTAAALFVSCAHGNPVPSVAAPAADQQPDDVVPKPARQPSVIMLSTANGLGSACPISAGLALTAAHVIDPRPYDPAVPLQSGFWSDPRDPWVEFGAFVPVANVRGRDVALISGQFLQWFNISRTAPQPGDQLFVQGYDWRKKDHALAARPWKVKVQYRAGQMASVSEDTQPGSSGSCVTNAAGEVVGILVWSFELPDGGVGVIVLVYGEEFKEPQP